MAACGIFFVALGSLSAGVLAVAVWLWLYRFQTSIPGPRTVPLLGNLLSFYKLPVLLDRLGRMHKRYGDVFRFYVGPKLVIVITQPEDVQRVLASSKMRDRDPYFMNILRLFQGNGLLVLSGETWKRHRKAIEPAFRTEELENFVENFNDCANLLCKQLAESSGAEVDLYPTLMMCTLHTIVATIFGTEMEYFEPDPQKRAEIVTECTNFSKILPVLIYRPWITLKLIRWMTAEGRTLNRQIVLIRRLAEKALAFGRANLDNIKSKRRIPLVNVLPEENPELQATDNEICDEMVTLISAGMETTSNTMGYALALLGLYPEWQDKAQRELDCLFGTAGDYLRPATTADISQLTVMDAIIKESLRLFTPAPTIPHLVAEDIPLAGGRYLAPRGSTVLVAFYLMHRHPELFPDPDKFDPGRFLEGGSATFRKACSYVPFGAGPRKCVGYRYAILQMKIVLATVLRRYRILPGSSRRDLEESVLSITGYPLSGYRITCIPRNNIPVGSQ